MPRHFIRIRDLGPDARSLLVRAGEIKKSRFRSELLRGKTIVLLFEKASTRTRLSFEVGIRRLGGQCIFMTPLESQLGRSEPLEDTARVIGRYNDGIVVRTFSEEKVRKLAEYSGLPVINALTDQGHPCQVLSDVFTMYERRPDLGNVKVAWVGDGNNMANSFIEAALVFGFSLTLACPQGYGPDAALSAEALTAGAAVTLTDDPLEAVAGAHFVNTDVWASMGQEAEQKARELAFKGFFVDGTLMSAAAPGARFMHCLPAHKGEEVSAEVFEGPASIVFDQAENRLHMQMALMEWVFAGQDARTQTE
ncbi:MAG: ornithine carbamoyltransferase [Desulfovibrio sp.]|jgi:ornithine carbamoyltransferase|nr:ornithine carbamoyltransferase [Desulfovibrio sp.]